MKTIELPQAVFASADLGRMKGYQLVAKSDEIDRETAQELCRWSPSQLPGRDPGSWTLNCAKLDETRAVISRSVRGGPEYSRRGGNQTVTLMAIIDSNEFGSYNFNAYVFLQTALTLGYLRLPAVLPYGSLEPMVLPADPLIRSPDALHFQEEHECEDDFLHDVLQRISAGQRLALIGLDNSLNFLSRLIPRMALESRMNFSFTSGLTPAVRRPFQLHFLDSIDPSLRRTLLSQQVKVIEYAKMTATTIASR